MDITTAIAGTRTTVNIIDQITRIVRSAFRLKVEIQLTNQELKGKSDIRTLLEEAFQLNNEKANATLALRAFAKGEINWEAVRPILGAIAPKLDELIAQLVKVSKAMIAAGRFKDANDLVERLQVQRSLYDKLANLPMPNDGENLQTLADELEKLRNAVVKIEMAIGESATTKIQK